jgi:hypothetical protein
MFVYTVLFVASLTVAITIPLLYYVFKRVRTTIYESVLPGSDSSSWAHLKAKLQIKKQQKIQKTQRFSAAEQAEVMVEGLCLVREDRPDEVGKSYKVSRRTSAKTSPNSPMFPKEQGTPIGPNARVKSF